MRRHREFSVPLKAAPEVAFEWLDDPARLDGHMSESSAVMGGGSMRYEFDALGGRAVGSRIKMRGQAFGIELWLEEEVTEHAPPRRKVWRTLGTPRLIVIGAYEMGFEITRAAGGSELRVWIDYEQPDRGPGRRAPVLGALYARWCVRQIAMDAARHFDDQVRS